MNSSFRRTDDSPITTQCRVIFKGPLRNNNISINYVKKLLNEKNYFPELFVILLM